MTQEHPITPPPELVKQWLAEIWHEGTPVSVAASDLHIATEAARWGYEQRGADIQKARDEELEACCEWLTTKVMTKPWETVPRPVLVTALVLELRAARRPKPQSLKEEALEALKHAEEGWRPVPADCAIIRRALESLPD